MKKGYPEYKDTKFEWLGAIPSHWGVAKIGVLFDQRNEKVSDTDFPALSVTKNGIVPQLENAAKTDAGDNRMLVRKGDFVINSRSDRKGSSGVSSLDGSVSLISIVLRPLEHNHRYIHHLFRSYNFQEEFYRNGKGIVADLWSTRYSEMKNIYIPVIPMDEQNSIADYLDKETSRIDGLISEKQNFINLLKEKRQALISHVVTKGLNPNVEMKDSGVEWIGEIPRHWDAKRIKHVAKVNPSTNRPEILPDESIGFVPMTNVNEKIGVIRKVDVRKYSEVSSGYTLFQNGDVIFAKITPCMENGNCAMIADMNYGIGFGSTEFIVFRPGKLIMQEYLHMVLRNNELRKICKRFMSGTAGQQRIATPFLENFPLALPPIEEQKAIVKEVGKKVKRLESLEDEVRKSIELLKEHRTALISAAVTGKIDLRNKEVA